MKIKSIQNIKKVKTAHHEKEYPSEILNMTVMQLLDKLENSNKTNDVVLYHSIEDYLDSINK